MGYLLLHDFFSFECEEGDEVDEEIKFVDIFACLAKLTEGFAITVARVHLGAFFVLEGVFEDGCDELLSHHLSKGSHKVPLILIIKLK